ncbi:uncharacterized protein T069G_11581 [Trichoderma breve]|uniref:Uncharacterized protein n=1 Tax=Trichoderma breve TaxID=2034170 RepID=A0A9W9E313_9HYPO|nr:uncharacterized protein T069G_11581 [Trichoderma breve]KAJ4854602.1 hypothetical protein T069G_11581 [Trichoderma breve]
MAHNTPNESGDRSSGISSGIIEEGVTIPGPDIQLMVRSGDSAANRRKARKAKKEEDMEMEMDIEGESEGDFESNIRSSGIPSGIVEQGLQYLDQICHSWFNQGTPQQTAGKLERP